FLARPLDIINSANRHVGVFYKPVYRIDLIDKLLVPVRGWCQIVKVELQERGTQLTGRYLMGYKMLVSTYLTDQVFAHRDQKRLKAGFINENIFRCKKGLRLRFEEFF